MSRRKGWRKPEDAIYVGRPTRWGNPYKVGTATALPRTGCHLIHITDASIAVDLYRRWLSFQRHRVDLVPELAGHDLACWCALDQPCHADVLLELANR